MKILECAAGKQANKRKVIFRTSFRESVNIKIVVVVGFKKV